MDQEEIQTEKREKKSKIETMENVWPLMNSFSFLENILISQVLLSCKFTFTVATLAIIKDKLCSKNIFSIFWPLDIEKLQEFYNKVIQIL